MKARNEAVRLFLFKETHPYSSGKTPRRPSGVASARDNFVVYHTEPVQSPEGTGPLGGGGLGRSAIDNWGLHRGSMWRYLYQYLQSEVSPWVD